MRSASTAFSTVTLAVALSGCATTQQEAARLRVNSARDRASAYAVRVSARNPWVVVQSVETIPGARSSAIIVRVRNRLSRPVSDLPISVWVLAAGGRRQYINGAPGDDYFLSHIPAIAPGGVLQWVLTTNRRLQRTARLSAAVGSQVPPQVPAPSALPRIDVTGTGPAGGRTIRLTVRNTSSVPQYQLQVYAVARRSGRDVAAGRATIVHLGTRATVALNVPLLGSADAGSVALEAPPTIFG